MIRPIILVFSLLIGVAQCATSQKKPTGLEDKHDKIVHYVIEDLSDDATDLGITESWIETKVELNLRRSGLTPVNAAKKMVDNQKPYLYVRLTVGGGAFNWHLDMARKVTYWLGKDRYDRRGVTWIGGITGTHGRDEDYIMDSLEESLEEFLNEYLKTNQE